MMMDDIFFEDPVKCQECLKIIEAGMSIWLNGRCLCPECYDQRKELDQQRGKEE